MPQVSIVVPAYNPGRFLKPALESVKNQTFTEWEVIVIDDGSSEDLEPICRSFPKMKYIKRKHCGQSVTRNAGIVASSGQYIAFLDHDDLWHPQKLERQVAAMNSDQDMALCYTNYQVIDHDGRLLHASRHDLQESLSKESDLTVFGAADQSYLAIASLGIPTCTVTMIRKSAFAHCGMFDPLLSSCEDHDLWFRLCMRYKSAYLRTAEASYRQHSAQHTRKLLSAANDDQVWARYDRLAKETGNLALAQAAQCMKSLARRNFSALAYDQAKLNFRDQNWVEALGCLRKSFTLDAHFTFQNGARWLLNRLKPPGAPQIRT